MSKELVTVVPTNENYNNALSWSTSASFTSSELASVTHEEVMELKASVGDLWVMDEIDFTMIDNFVYDGFDYQRLFKNLILIQKKKKFLTSTMKDYISKALAIHQLMGNVSSKRFNSLSGPGKEIVNSTISALNIKLGKKTGLHAGDLTFPRLGALFPFPLSVIANKFPKDFASKYNTTSLPYYMKTSSFPSLIPAGQSYSQLLLKAYEAYSVDMTIALRGKDINTIDTNELLSISQAQSKYSALSHGSGVLDTNTRIRAMRALRVDNLETYQKLHLVANNFGVTNLPSYTEWNTMLVSSYATLRDDQNVALSPLPGKAFERPSGHVETPQEKAAREARAAGDSAPVHF